MLNIPETSTQPRIMTDPRSLHERLTTLGKGEQSFRQLVVRTLTQLLLDSLTPRDLKILIVLSLVVFVGISFYVFILLIIAPLFLLAGKDFQLAYVLVIPALTVLLLPFGIPLVLKASSAEQAMRLRDDFGKISDAKLIL